MNEINKETTPLLHVPYLPQCVAQSKYVFLDFIADINIMALQYPFIMHRSCRIIGQDNARQPLHTDYFSKWPEAESLQEKSAEACVFYCHIVNEGNPQPFRLIRLSQKHTMNCTMRYLAMIICAMSELFMQDLKLGELVLFGILMGERVTNSSNSFFVLTGLLSLTYRIQNHTTGQVVKN